MDKLIENYNIEYKNKIESSKDKLIEAFVMYYGEEHRNLITDKFNSIIFLWYLDPDISYNYKIAFELKKRIKETKKILKMLGFSAADIEYEWRYFDKNNPICYVKNVINEDKENLDKPLLLLFGKTRLLNNDSTSFFSFSTLTEKEKIKFVKKLYGFEFVETNDIESVSKASEYANKVLHSFKDVSKFIELNKYINSVNKSKINKIVGMCGNKEYYKFIVEDVNEILKKRKSDEKGKLDNRVLASAKYYLKDRKLINGVIFKIGIIDDATLIHEINHCISCSIVEDKMVKCGISCVNIGFLEELLIEKTTFEITKYFHELNGNLFDDFPIIESKSAVFFPLIDRFYDLLKEPLKKIRIEENFDLLFKYVDEQIFINYCQFIECIYEKCSQYNLPLITEDIDYANKLIDLMIKKEYKKTARQSMIDCLKSLSYKLKMISSDEIDKMKVKI